LIDLLDGNRGRCPISAVVLAEVQQAPQATAKAILRLMANSDLTVHSTTPEVEELARRYLSAGVVPPKRVSDALHVATATCFGDDYLVSWNHRHMTRPSKRAQFEAVGRLHGYHKAPMICNPVEACDELRSQ
jgi:predicted nucleic acid-binding protein